jgi:dethiobiotin synthetase
MSPRTIFITGTDTGVGKTVLTGLLLAHLRDNGVSCLATKPFCSGGREDAELLYALQQGELTLDQINPFYFDEPLAPFVAARAHRRSVRLDAVLNHIRSITFPQLPAQGIRGKNSKVEDSPILLIEGVGGLLVPLGRKRKQNVPVAPRNLRRGCESQALTAVYTPLDLIVKLRCETVVVAHNQLGTLNHTLLTLRALQGVGIKQLTVVLMNPRHTDSDLSSASNPDILARLLSPVPVLQIPFLGQDCCRPFAILNAARKLKPVLNRIANT